MSLHQLPRLPFAHLPTPLEEMPRLSEALGGPQLWIKRDDQTGLAMGGNKTRKLEFLIADALEQGATVVVTGGALQSNHCRQTAAAAGRAGLGCALVLGGEAPATPNGNLFLDQLLGAQIHWSGPERRGERLQGIFRALQEKGERPYLIPYGGSNPIGATGYVLAMQELKEQLNERGLEMDRIVVASSSGGTQAGMVVGAAAAGIDAEIIGIAIDKGEGADPHAVQLARLATETAEHIGLDRTFTPDDFSLDDNYLGGGYGIVGKLEREAIHLAARHEGLLLDPVYTGRAMGGLVDLIRQGSIPPDETILFWHTGGTPALFAYVEELQGRDSTTPPTRS
ncbi:MAG: D-cysteine desulfhydrase family protein [Chloroflexota bacterium]|nr:D-cysteine desulfhydrase family protein [Chloroflexota bacterium]